MRALLEAIAVGTSHQLRTTPRRVRDYLLELARILLGQSFANGLSVAFGLTLVGLAAYAAGGLRAASVAALGAVVVSMPDLPAQRKHKLQQLLPAVFLGAPLYLAIQLAQRNDLQQGTVLVLGTFVAYTATAWGKRGVPLSISMVFSMVFSMAGHDPENLREALHNTGWFGVGALAYTIHAVAANGALNRRYRDQCLAEALFAFSRTLRAQSLRFSAQHGDSGVSMGSVLAQQAALADTLQSTRDIVLESPNTLRRQRRAAVLLALLEARDQLLACEIDLDLLARHDPASVPMSGVQRALRQLARHIDRLAGNYLLGRTIARHVDALPPWTEPRVRHPGSDAAAAALVRGVLARVGMLHDQVAHLTRLARAETPPELAAVRENWQLFVSSTAWSWKPLHTQLGWYAPTLRLALRAALAVGAAYVVALHLPWNTHPYWVVLSSAVVLRANMAQTLERRNARVLGTVFGALLVMGFLAAHPRPAIVLLTVALATAVAHAFAVKRYWITALAATVQALLQAHLLATAVRPSFAAAERIADTVIGAGIAWAFSYVLPFWEHQQLPELIRRTLAAQRRHARLALEPRAESAADIEWRLARREAYDSLSALVQATSRSRSEPRMVQPLFEPLETLQAHCYRMGAQLTNIKSTLQLRSGQLDMDRLRPALERTAAAIEAALDPKTVLPAAIGDAGPAMKRPRRNGRRTPSATSGAAAGATLAAEAEMRESALERPADALADDLTPWLLHRVELVQRSAEQVRQMVARTLG